MEFAGNIFPRFNTLQLNEEVKRLLLRLDETPENFTRRIIFMSMFNDISCGSRDNEKIMSNANLVSPKTKRFGTRQRSFHGPGSEKKWYCISEDSPQGVWENMAEKMMLEFAESGCPSKRRGKLSIHVVIMMEQEHPLWGRHLIRAKCDQNRSSFGLDVLARKDLSLQQYGERIKKFLQQYFMICFLFFLTC